VPILLQNSKVAAVKIFGENLKRKEVDDSHSFSRATEVAHEFGARRRGPSDHYTKNAPAAPRIFDTSCKTTFATQSGREADISKMPNLVRCRLQTCSKQSNRQSAQMVGLLETVNRCGNAFHSRLQLEGQKLGVVA
jgi:hypothetical protein